MNAKTIVMWYCIVGTVVIVIIARCIFKITVKNNRKMGLNKICDDPIGCTILAVVSVILFVTSVSCSFADASSKTYEAAYTAMDKRDEYSYVSLEDNNGKHN